MLHLHSLVASHAGSGPKFSLVVLMLLFTGVQPLALNLSQNARGRVPVLPYVVPTALSAQTSASATAAKQGILCICAASMAGIHTIHLVSDLAVFTILHP